MHMGNYILFFRTPPPYGGGEIVNEYLIKYWGKSQFIVALSNKNASKSSQGKLNYQNLFYSIKNIIHIHRILSKSKPKIIFIGLSKSLIPYLRDVIILIIARIKDIGVIGDLHGMGFNMNINNNIISKSIFNWSINKYQAIRFLSHSIKNHVRQSGFNGRCYVIDNGISKSKDSFSKTYSPLEKISLFYFGAISKSKGIEICLKLILKLKDNNINYKFTVIGEFVDTSTRIFVKEFIEQNDLSQFVKLEGRLLDSEKFDCISDQHLLLHASKWDGQPLTVLESMSFGIPSIVSDVGALPETVQNGITGFVVTDFQSEAYNYIIAIITGKISYDRLSQQCVEVFNKRFSIEICANKIDEMLNYEANNTIPKNG